MGWAVPTSRGCHSACSPAPETDLRSLTLTCNWCCSCCHLVSSSTFQWERAIPRQGCLLSPTPTSPCTNWVLPELLGEGYPLRCAFLLFSSLFFLLLLSSELFASFSISFLLPIYLLDFSQPLPLPSCPLFDPSLFSDFVFFWGGWVARFQVLSSPHQGLNSGLQQWKSLNPNHCQGNSYVFYFLMSPFLSFLFSDSLFLSSSFLFICHSSSKGCKLVTGEPNSAHNWALLGPQGGLFFLVFFFFFANIKQSWDFLF